MQSDQSNGDELSRRFEAARPRLFALARRLLGDRYAAEDAVQDTWRRLARPGATDLATIDNLDGWLRTTLTRVCLNRIRARGSHPEATIEPADLELVVHSDDASGPEPQAQLADQVRFALDLVLRTLTPPERLAFILHDSFGLPFAEIAPLLDRTVEATRKLASRARARVRTLDPDDLQQDRSSRRQTVDAFYRASRQGDLSALVDLLHPEVIFTADGGRVRPEATAIITGARAVADRATSFAIPAADIRPLTVNGAAAALVLADDRPVSLMIFVITGTRISHLHVLLDPQRIQRLLGPTPDSPTARSRQP